MDKVEEQVSKQVQRQFNGLHNLWQLVILRQKIKCYDQYHSDPLAYYTCFDRLQKGVLRDARQLLEFKEYTEDGHTICLYECRQKAGQEKECAQNCDRKLVSDLVGLYRDYYRERLQKCPQYTQIAASINSSS